MEGNEKFINRYRIESTRLPGWNYGEDGYYFITICTKNREFYFGDVLCDNGGEWSVALSPIGKIVRDELLNTPRIRSNVKLDVWVIMPNHIHVIIIIDNNDCRDALHASQEPTALHASHKTRGTSTYGYIKRDACNASLRDGNVVYKNVFGPQRNNLASIVRGFKSTVTKQCNELGYQFAWQTRYYDRIIRDERALYAVRQYIKINPQKWQRDRNNSNDIWM